MAIHSFFTFAEAGAFASSMARQSQRTVEVSRANPKRASHLGYFLDGHAWLVEIELDEEPKDDSRWEAGLEYDDSEGYLSEYDREGWSSWEPEYGSTEYAINADSGWYEE